MQTMRVLESGDTAECAVHLMKFFALNAGLRHGAYADVGRPSASGPETWRLQHIPATACTVIVICVVTV